MVSEPFGKVVGLADVQSGMCERFILTPKQIDAVPPQLCPLFNRLSQ